MFRRLLGRLDFEARRNPATVERRWRCEGHRLDAGRAPQLGDRVAHESELALAVVVQSHRIHAERDDALRLHPEICVPKVLQRAHEHAGARQQRHRQCQLHTDEPAAQSAGRARGPMRLGERARERRLRRGKRRRHTVQEDRDAAERDSEDDDPPVEKDFIQRRSGLEQLLALREPDQQPANHETQSDRTHRDQPSFDKETARQPPAARANRMTECQIARLRHRPRQQEVGRIGAGQQKQQAACAERKRVHLGNRAARPRLADRRQTWIHDGDDRPRTGPAHRHHHAHGRRVRREPRAQLLFCDGDGDVRPQTANEREDSRRKFKPGRDGRCVCGNPDVDGANAQGAPAAVVGDDAGDDGRMAADRDRLADRRGIPAESASPPTLADQRDGPPGSEVVWCEKSPGTRPHAQRVEIAVSDDFDFDELRVGAGSGDHRKLGLARRAQRDERAGGPERLERVARRGKVGGLPASRLKVDGRELVGIGDAGNRPKQHVIEHGECGRARRQTHREDQHDGGGRPGLTRHRAPRQPDIQAEAFERAPPVPPGAPRFAEGSTGQRKRDPECLDRQPRAQPETSPARPRGLLEQVAFNGLAPAAWDDPHSPSKRSRSARHVFRPRSVPAARRSTARRAARSAAMPAGRMRKTRRDFPPGSGVGSDMVDSTSRLCSNRSSVM